MKEGGIIRKWYSWWGGVRLGGVVLLETNGSLAARLDSGKARENSLSHDANQM